VGADAAADRVKFLIKLALAALIANAIWRVGSEYVTYYRFRDSVRDAALARALDDAQLKNRIVELAGEYSLPIGESDFVIRRQERRTSVEGTYVKPIMVLPGYEYLWRFDWTVDGFVAVSPSFRDLSPGTSPD
jgi:hypothetical protein